MVQQRLAKTEVRSRESMNKVNTERGYIKLELNNARDDLTQISQQLTKAQMNYAGYIEQIENTLARLSDNKQEMDVLVEKNDIARTLEEMQAKIVKNLQSKVTEAQFEHRQVESESQRLEQKLKVNKDKHTSALTSLEQQRKSLDVQLWKLARKIQEQNVDIEDCEEKITKCDQQKAADLKTMARINQDLERTTTILEQTEEKCQQLSDINQQLKEQLENQQYETFYAEENLKKTSESMRRQIQEEIHTKTVLEAKIRSDLLESEKAKLDLVKKKEKAKIMTDELNQALAVVVQKVNKLQVNKAEMQKEKYNLGTKNQETELQFKDSSENFRQIIEKLEPENKTVKNDLSNLSDQLQDMDQHSLSMKKQIEEMDAAQVMMDKVAAGLTRDIDILLLEMHEVNLQIESARKISDDLRTQFNNTQERLRDNENNHKQLLKERLDYLAIQETNKAELIEKNKDLASRYRQLQQQYIIEKDAMLKSYDERVQLESAIKDMKQLKSFQLKLHCALVEYFKYRERHNMVELTKLEQESSNNGVRVSELQINMERALEEIASFLGSQKKVKIAAKSSSTMSTNENKSMSSLPPVKNIAKLQTGAQV